MIDSSSSGSTRFSSRLPVVALALVVAIGCGPSVPPPPATQAVHGIVKLNGEPVSLEGAAYVRFVPTDPAKGRFADGMIAEDGSYSVAAFKGQAGTVPGEYKVCFSSVSAAAESEAVTAPPLKLPKKYLSPDTTDLTVTVANGDNDLDLDLQGEVEDEADEMSEEESSE